MKTKIFLQVDEQSINLAQAIAYLHSSGKLASFVSEIIRQYVLEQELQKVKLTNTVVEKAINSFRQQHQLLEPDKFEQWLAQQNLTSETFQRQVTTRSSSN